MTQKKKDQKPYFRKAIRSADTPPPGAKLTRKTQALQDRREKIYEESNRCRGVTGSLYLKGGKAEKKGNKNTVKAFGEAWRTKWVNKKRAIAHRLNSGKCGGSYGEAALILCSALSALAAEVWPGKGIDRKRFVELLKDFAPGCLGTTKISIPLLLASLQDVKKGTEVCLIKKSFLNQDSAAVLIGDEVDKPEAKILRVCRTLSLKELRKCSYANLLYREVRSGYVHQYKPGKKADSSAMNQKRGVYVSYVGYLDVNNLDRDPEERIHFGIEWISELTVSVARKVDAKAKSLPFRTPSQWWVDG